MQFSLDLSHNNTISPKPIDVQDSKRTPAVSKTTSIRSVLQTVAHRGQEQALSGRQISEKVGCSSRDAQRLLPQLAIKNRVSREMRYSREDDKTLYFYWMTKEQRDRFEVGRNKVNLQKLVDQLLEQNRSLNHALAERDQIITSLREDLFKLKCFSPELKDPLKLSQRLHFVEGLLGRPALSEMHHLHEIRRDYRQALSVAREME